MREHMLTYVLWSWLGTHQRSVHVGSIAFFPSLSHSDFTSAHL